MSIGDIGARTVTHVCRCTPTSTTIKIVNVSRLQYSHINPKPFYFRFINHPAPQHANCAIHTPPCARSPPTTPRTPISLTTTLHLQRIQSAPNQHCSSHIPLSSHHHARHNANFQRCTAGTTDPAPTLPPRVPHPAPSSPIHQYHHHPTTSRPNHILLVRWTSHSVIQQHNQLL